MILTLTERKTASGQCPHPSLRQTVRQATEQQMTAINQETICRDAGDFDL